MKKIKKLLSIVLTIVCMCSLIPASVGASSSNEPLTLTAGKSKITFFSGTTLTVTNNSSSNKIKKVAWSSSDTSIATVKSQSTSSSKATAYVTGVNGGTATITVKVQMSDGVTYKKSKNIKVSNYALSGGPTIHNVNSSGENIYTNKTAVGNTYSISFWYPSNEQITWSVSDSSLASIHKEFTETAAVSGTSYSSIKNDVVTVDLKKAGTVKVTAKNQKGEKVASGNIKIKPYVKKLAFNDGNKLSMTKGKTKTLKYTIKNIDGNKVSKTPSEVVFSASTSDSSVVKIKSSSSGKISVKAVGKGTATVKVKAKDGSGASASIKITVK